MTRWRRIVTVMVTVLLTAGLTSAATPSAAVELTRVMPDHVLAFVTTSGADALGPDCRQTVLGQLCTDSGVTAFYASIKDELLGLLSEEEGPEARAIVNMALQYAELGTSRPIIAGVAGVDIDLEDGPPVCLFAILDAGLRKAEVKEAVSKLEELIREEENIVETQVGSAKMHKLESMDEVPLYWGWVGDRLVLALNDPDGVVIKHVQTPRPQATDHLNKLADHGDILAGYCNVAKAWSTVKSSFFVGAGHHEMKLVTAIMDLLGVTQMGVVVARTGVSGKEIISDSFTEVSGSRTGMLAALKPVDASAMGAVDARAVTASTFDVDLGHIFDAVMGILRTALPDDAYAEATGELAKFESEIGFKIRDGLLASLGGPMVVYTLPAGTMVEAPMGGVVVTAKLRDPALFEKTMAQVEALIGKEAGDQLQIGAQADAKGRTVHTWSMPAMAMLQAMPTWCVAGDRFVFGLNPGVHTMGMKLIDAKDTGDKSLLQVEKFKKTAADLPENLLSLMYVDSEVQFKQMMMQVQQAWPLLAMGAAQAEVRLPAILPSLDHIASQMRPSIEYVYTKDDGIYSHYQGPGIQMSLRDIAGTSLAMGVLMPALARTRQLAFRMTSGTNLSQIGMACLIYANDYDDKLPPTLQTLVDECGLSPESLVSKRKTPDHTGPSYIYIAGQTIMMNPGNVVAYEDPAYCIDGANVLFLDSHVEFMKPEAFRKEVGATYQRLGREVPEFRFADE